MQIQEVSRILVRSPDGRKAGRFCCHYVDSVSEIRCHGRYSRSYKLHDFVFDVSVFEHSTDDGKCNILRSHPGIRLSVKINCDNLWTCDIVRVTEKLFYQLTAALTDRHCSHCAVPGMGIRSENHLSASGVHFSHKLMNDCDVRRNIDAAVFLRCGKAKYMVIFVDRSADGTQRVMAVGQHIRNWKFFHSGRFCRLNDTYKRDIVGRHCIKFQLEILHISGGIMCLHDAIGNGSLSSFFFCDLLSRHSFHSRCFCFRHKRGSVYQVCACII